MKETDTTIRTQAGQQTAFIYRYKGQECPFIHITDPKLIKSYADYALIEQDLLMARENFEQLLATDLETANHIIQRSLLSDAIISYGRCFTEGEGKAVILDPNQVFKGFDAQRSTHDFMMTLRHRFFAHSGGSEYESVMVYLALNPDKKSGFLEIYRGLARASAMEEQVYKNAINSINCALDWIKVKLDEAYQRLKIILTEHDVDNLYSQSIAPETLGKDVHRVYKEAE